MSTTNATTAGNFGANEFKAVLDFMAQFKDANPFKDLARQKGRDLDKGDWMLLPLGFFEHPETRPLLEHVATRNVFLFPWWKGDLLIFTGAEIHAPPAQDWQITTLLPGGYIETDCLSGRQRRISKETGRIEFLPATSRQHCIECGRTGAELGHPLPGGWTRLSSKGRATRYFCPEHAEAAQRAASAERGRESVTIHCTYQP